MAESSHNDIATLLENLLKILKEEHVFDKSGNQPVVKFVHPEELQHKISFSLDKDPMKQQLKSLIRQIIQYSVKTSSPHFHNQLYGGVDKYGLVGSWLTEVLNTSQYTYEVAPVFTMIEHEVIKKSLQLVGYPSIPLADGIMCPGGSIANMYAMTMARYKKFPEVKKLGVSWIGKPLTCLTSEDGHYSILKAAHWLGIGTDNVYKVKTDKYGRMEVDDLKKIILKLKNEGQLPFFVNATAGTTVLGAIDPLVEIAEICQNEDIWLHVDACLGGSLLLSEKYRSRLRGIELSDSVAWNPHKMLGAPLQCSLFLVKGEKALHKANSFKANYLFQQDKFYDVSWDTGDKSVQCGRKVDAMKFWLMWKVRGTTGLGLFVENAMYCVEYFLKRIQETPGFRLVQSNYQSCTVCFWYIPTQMRDKPETVNWWKQLYNVTTEIKKSLTLSGSVMIGYTPLLQRECGNFFRMVATCQPPPTRSSMDYVIKEIEKASLDLEQLELTKLEII
ncbi:acidic amino acid decarboxylase GADL1 [Anoplolepis gracilipes]|uniref:acidic amino acid decarboxylase GADL1 n=1 Tax=Anoplolepis gracilipes TaxID=354296 RepID=UPI003B9E17B2